MHTVFEDILYTYRHVSPFAMICALLAVFCLVMFLITKWREFFMVGLTAAVYIIPFVLWDAGHGGH